ncbi:MAG: hypothetical protein E6G45_08525 [Actinobacteria bacterium]|nr:MAG: hypothetical protein E6G45_08525 [Actinomycetota bacterium]
MRPAPCHLLDAVDVQEPCPGEQCPFWDEDCLLAGLRSDMSTNPLLVRFLLGLREDLEDGSRPLLIHAPGF